MTSTEPLFSMAHARTDAYAVEEAPDVLRSGQLERAIGRRRALLVVSPTVETRFAPALEAIARRAGGRIRLTQSASGEPAKRWTAVEGLCETAFAAGLDRRSVMVAVGGGICSDLVTVAASMFRRGVPHIRVPTTLVGQIDAALGAKGAVNLAGHKNAIGCFHPPERVLVDRALLGTLPPAEISAGLAEIIKMALVSDRELFELVARAAPRLRVSAFQEPAGVACQIVQVAARRMLEALEGDLFERKSYRRIVDAGHTFSPQLEAAAGFRLRHGEAVAIDLALSANLSVALGLLGAPARDRILEVLRLAGLPADAAELTDTLCMEALDHAVAHRGGRLHLPLFADIGVPRFVDDIAAVQAALPSALHALPATAPRLRLVS